MLHTLNLRLFPEQLAYIVNHAEDRVDHRRRQRSCPLLAPLAPELTSVEQYVVVGDADASALEGAPKAQVLRYDELLAAERPG